MTPRGPGLVSSNARPGKLVAVYDPALAKPTDLPRHYVFASHHRAEAVATWVNTFQQRRH
jgi:hypothetical protein